MPITSFQSDVLRTIAANRDPESYVAGGTAINRSGPRFSADVDIFHDRQERVAEAAMSDATALRRAGYELAWTRQQPASFAAIVRDGRDETKIEWIADSDYRFFPAVADPVFGYVLHPVDLAINKVMAAASRREPRDIIDLLTLHSRVAPLGALVWAAADIAPGFTPEGLIAEIRRNARHPKEEWLQVMSAGPVEPEVIAHALRSALDDADAFVKQMPTTKSGLLFLRDGRPVQPDPSRLNDYSGHRPRRRGHWPSSPEITTAMLERLKLDRL